MIFLFFPLFCHGVLLHNLNYLHQISHIDNTISIDIGQRLIKANRRCTHDIIDDGFYIIPVNNTIAINITRNINTTGTLGIVDLAMSRGASSDSGT